MADPRSAPFGRVLVAMVTPFTTAGAVDYDGAQRLATHLLGTGCDGLVVNGTTGEAPTTTDSEKESLVRAVVEAVGPDVPVLAGVGTNDTAHTQELARTAEKAGASGLLVVTPYYSKPTQSGLLQHFRAVADVTGLPNLLYDIPSRSGAAIESETIVRLAEHDRIVGVKDAKDDLAASSWVLARTDLAYYSGTDILTLPLLSIGAVGVVSVIGHLFGRELSEMCAAYQAGDVTTAARLHRQLTPAFVGFFRAPGVVTTKAALRMLGLPGGPVRLPLVDATDDEVTRLRADLTEAGATGLAGVAR